MMQKTFQPKENEQKLYRHWEEAGYFQPQGGKQSYCITIPPPNVTGSLHMGHGFQQTLMDALIRYHRMRGFNTLWQAGTDHAGIATQMMVENQLHQQQKTRHDLGRETFINQVWAWKTQSGGQITQQMRRLGLSVDWSRECFTMDAHFADAVKHIFIQLYQEGLIYRGKRLVNWDPHFKSAISNLEVINTEEPGKLWHIRYPLVDQPNDYVSIATTRPETLLGDVAVAVHPEDTHYQSLIGKQLQLPLCERTIPIIADEYVDPAFGSGCVKITPAHDFNDYEVGQRHQLTPLNIFTEDAHINQNAPQKYQGLDRFEARKQILKDLETAGLLEKTETHKLNVPRNERGGNIVEPYLTDQWFVKTTPLAKKALDAVAQGKTRFVPENWTKIYNQWLENIEDWCISRQLWWGHRIPAWYDNDGNIYVGRNEEEVRKTHQLGNTPLTQDEDVLDTWFSSGIWPFATLGWPENTKTFETFYPTQVLVTGFDIIFFWVARMMMFGLKFTDQAPFEEIYITGLIRDQDGQKMSKTKGNVLDPIDLIDGISLDALIKKRTDTLIQSSQKAAVEKATKKQFPDGIEAHGTDALRFTFCALATPGRDINFDVSRLAGYRNFCNKLWNAAQFVLLQLSTIETPTPIKVTKITGPKNLINQYILSRLEHTIEQAHRHFSQYRFDLLAQCLYEFVWNEYCDWYLELVKPILFDSNFVEIIINPLESKPSLKRKLLPCKNNPAKETLETLVYVLDQILRLLHPIIPFITETIWENIKPYLVSPTDTIMLAPYPEENKALLYPAAEEEVDWIKQFIIAIRNIRGEMNIPPGKKLPVLFNKGTKTDKKRVQKHGEILFNFAKLNSLEELTSPPPAASTALIGELEILIPMADLIDKEAELKRLQKAIDKTQKDIQHTQTKLDNPNFVNKAPQAVVDKEKTTLNALKETLKKLQAQQAKIQQL